MIRPCFAAAVAAAILSVAHLAGAQTARPNLVLIVTDDVGYGDIGSLRQRLTSRRPTSIGSPAKGVRFTDFYAAPTCSPTRAVAHQRPLLPPLSHRTAAASAGAGRRSGPAPDGPVAAGAAQGRGLCHRPHRQVAPRLQAGAEPERARVRLLLRLQERPDRLLPAHRAATGSTTSTRTTARRTQPATAPISSPIAPCASSTSTPRVRSFWRWRTTRRTGRSRCRIVRRWRPTTPASCNRWTTEPRRGPITWRSSSGPTRGSGRFWRRWPRAGLDRNTLVVFMNDNGGEWLSRNAPLFHRKDSVWEGGVRVPAIMRWPGRIPAGRVTPQVGIVMDVTATLLAAGGVTVPAEARPDGINLLPILEGRTPPVERTLFFRNTVGGRQQRAVRRGNWKLLVDGPNTFVFDLVEGRRRAQRPGVVAVRHRADAAAAAGRVGEGRGRRGDGDAGAGPCPRPARRTRARDVKAAGVRRRAPLEGAGPAGLKPRPAGRRPRCGQ